MLTYCPGACWDPLALHRTHDGGQKRGIDSSHSNVGCERPTPIVGRARKDKTAGLPRAHDPWSILCGAKGPGSGRLTDTRILFTKVECPLAQPFHTLVADAASAGIGSDRHISPESTDPNGRVKD
jgi:hypothetical protein